MRSENVTVAQRNVSNNWNKNSWAEPETRHEGKALEKTTRGLYGDGFVKAAKRRGLKAEPAKRGPADWYERKFYVNAQLCLLDRLRMVDLVLSLYRIS